MTPCENRGYKVGDRFVVREGYQTSHYRGGDVVVLVDDDQTVAPIFTNETTSEEDIFITLCKVDKIADTWNGEGLPPVGTLCKYVDKYSSREGTIAVHLVSSTEVKTACIQYPEGGYDCSTNPANFQPIKPEKTGAKLMEEIFNKSGIQGLIDAGYRK